MGDSHMGLQARLMSQALRKITGNIGKSGCTVVFLNQLRQKIGVTYGNPETTTGGNALKFYASVRLDIRRIQTLKRGTEIEGTASRSRLHKVAPPFRMAEFDIILGVEFLLWVVLLTWQKKLGLLSARVPGYNGDNISQGRDNAIKYLEEKPEVAREVEQRVRQKLEMGAIVSANSVMTLGNDEEAIEMG